MKIIALEESFWYDKLATEGNTARAWLQLKSAVAAAESVNLSGAPLGGFY